MTNIVEYIDYRQFLLDFYKDLVKNRKEAVLNSESYKFFKSWKYSVIREVASTLKILNRQKLQSCVIRKFPQVRLARL